MDKTIANPSPKEVIGRASECMRRLLEAGLPFEALQKPIDDPEMRKRLVRFWISGGFEPSASQKRAREILGKNCFGIEEAIKHFGVNPSKQQLAALSEVPFTEAALEECKNTHILVAVFPLSILDIRGKVERKLFYSHGDAWYNKQAFAQDYGDLSAQAGVSWYLVRKDVVSNSTSKNWSEQVSLLAKDEEVPSTRVMVYAIIGHYLVTGERLFENVWVRCSDLDSSGDRVFVGYFNRDGLLVNFHWDAYRSSVIGLASSRKFQ